MTVATAEERAFTMKCNGQTLVGVLSPGTASVGLIIVVGGPQYRVGSHRMYVTIARAIAARSFPVLRFDVRGMGDSTGSFPTFERMDDDIAAAVDYLMQRGGCSSAVLFGLCDGASAVAMYVARDPRVVGVVLVNPWVRTVASKSQAMLRDYYGARLLSRTFWKKLLTGRINIVPSLIEVARNLLQLSTATRVDDDSYINRMRQSLERFDGDIDVLLSGRDIVAAEFESLIQTSSWASLQSQPSFAVHRFPKADHTFSHREQLQSIIDAIGASLSRSAKVYSRLRMEG